MFHRSIVLASALLASAALTPTASSQSLPNGGSLSSSLTVPGQTNVHTFFANGGEGFQIQVVDSNLGALDPRVEVFDPSGNSIGARAASTVARVAGVAPRSGTYRVEVSDGNVGMTQTGPYRVYYTRAPGANEGGTLPNGGRVSSTIEVGDLDSYTFPMLAGEEYQLRYADTGATGLDPRMTVYDPMGSVVGTSASSVVASLAQVAPLSGTYTVVLGDGNVTPAGSGPYDLYFARTPGANSGGLLTSGTSLDQSTALGEIDSYTFTIAAGDYYLLRLADLGTTGLDPTLWLYDPRGCRVSRSVGSNIAALQGVAVFSGTYTVLVSDGNTTPTGTGAYRLHYQRVPGPVSSGALALGSSRTGRIEIGDLDSYTFEVQAGERYMLQMSDLNATGLDPSLRIFDPRGELLGSSVSSDVARFTSLATLSGTYTAVLSDGNTAPSATGDYAIFYERFPGATGEALFPGTVASGSITRGELDTFTFDLDIGDSYRMHMVDTGNTGLDPRMELYGPRGSLITQSVASVTAAIAGTANRAGTYTLLLRDGNTTPSAIGNYELHYVRAPGANEHGFLVDGQVATETIELGDLDSYTFRASAGQTVQITMTDLGNTSLDPRLVLYGPFGRVLGGSISSTAARVTQLLTRSGTYTVLALDGNTQPTATGAYTIELTGSGASGNPGCSNEGPPVLDRRPSLQTGFTIEAAAFSRTCTGPSTVLLGVCATSTAVLTSPLSCGPCGTELASIVLSGTGSVTVPPLPPALVGLTLCAQSICPTSSCLNLSANLQITLEP